MVLRGANFPPIISWKISNTLGSFSFSGSNLSVVCFGLLKLFRRRYRRSSSASRGHFQCLLLKNFVFWQCSLLIESASSLERNQSGCGVVLLAMPGPSSECFVMPIVKGGKQQKSESFLICVIIAEGSTNALPVSTSIPAHFCIPVSLHNKNVPFRCLINDFL